jgi:hypothetical protein
MRLVRATAWIKETFEEGHRPRKDVVKGWIEAGEVPGTALGGVHYVDADQFVKDVRDSIQGPSPQHIPKPDSIADLDLLG